MWIGYVVTFWRETIPAEMVPVNVCGPKVTCAGPPAQRKSSVAGLDSTTEVLKVHERAETRQIRDASSTTPQMQMTMFTPLSQRIVDRLGEVDVDGLTPREALNLLAELQQELKG